MYHLNKNSLSDFVSLKTNISNQNSIFLVDTEATVSLIKISSISNNISYNKNDIIKMTGIVDTPLFSLGSFNLKIVEQNVEYEHKFHLISNDFKIPSNGVIGKDFLKRFKCLVDYGNMILTMRKKENENIQVPIQSEILNGVSALPPRSETFKFFHI